MEYITDGAVGAWLRDGMYGGPGTWPGAVGGTVPRGFARYARVFHPAHRERPVGIPWPPLPYDDHGDAWEAFFAENPVIDCESVTWEQTAQAMGTIMHPGAQWEQLVLPCVIVAGEDGPRDAEGWRYRSPDQGEMPPETLATLAGVLSRYTSTPDDGVAAVWEGFDSPVRNMVTSLRLPGRDYVLFRACVRVFADQDWVLDAPWRERELEERGFSPQAQTPSLLWPKDHAWVMACDVDLDSTIIAGSTELVEALCAEADIEVLPVEPTQRIDRDADTVNRAVASMGFPLTPGRVPRALRNSGKRNASARKRKGA